MDAFFIGAGPTKNESLYCQVSKSSTIFFVFPDLVNWILVWVTNMIKIY
jgi:hypothetical protein